MEYFCNRNPKYIIFSVKKILYNYICEICAFTTVHKNSFKIHVEQHQRGKKSHQCHICSARFNLACAVRRHIKRDHTDDPTVEKPYQCDKCNAKYAFPRSLKKHKMAAHEKNSDSLTSEGREELAKEIEDKIAMYPSIRATISIVLFTSLNSLNENGFKSPLDKIRI